MYLKGIAKMLHHIPAGLWKDPSLVGEVYKLREEASGGVCAHTGILVWAQGKRHDSKHGLEGNRALLFVLEGRQGEKVSEEVWIPPFVWGNLWPAKLRFWSFKSNILSKSFKLRKCLMNFQNVSEVLVCSICWSQLGSRAWDWGQWRVEAKAPGD